MTGPTPSATRRIASPWPFPPPSCWCVTDGKPGMENQAVGLAEAMGLAPAVKRVALRALWRIASPHITAFKRYALSDSGDPLLPPWPDIVIATGRASVLPALYIKGQSGGRTFAVQLQDPVSLRSRFDRIVTPAHDCVTGANVIAMEGALHRVRPHVLEAAKTRFAAAFEAVPQPRVAVLLGGSNGRYALGEPEVLSLAASLRQLCGQGFGLLITPSRRTGAETMSTLRSKLDGCGAYIWDGSGENPYFGILAHARAFVVTCDSVNMISEACSTGKPVHVFELPARGKRFGGADKFATFRDGLRAAGRIRTFDGRIETWPYEPLLEMERVARLVRDAYLNSRPTLRE